jgi:peroxiredoxin
MSTETTELNNPNPPDSGRNPIILIGGLILLLGAFVVLIFGGRLFGSEDPALAEIVSDAPAQAAAFQLPSGGPPLQVGDQPYEFNLQGVDGESIILSQFVGRPILVNFWATWCGPCRLEMPEIQAVWQEYQDDGLVVLALDQDESAEDVSAFFDELGLTFTPALDEGSRTAANYGLPGTLPASVFINADGEITTIHRGIMTRGQLDTFLEGTFLADTLPSGAQS